MRAYIQWAQATAPIWTLYDVASSAELPSKAEPVGGETLDNTPGWVAQIKITGLMMQSGWDHVAFDAINGEPHLWCWNDDPTDWPVGERFGLHTWPGHYEWYADDHWNPRAVVLQQRVLYPFEDFPTPASTLTRHGIWVPDYLWTQHLTVAGSNPEWVAHG